MRELYHHRPEHVTGQNLNEFIRIEVYDDPDKNKVHHAYQLYIKPKSGLWERLGEPIRFQKGPLYITDAMTDVVTQNVNGISEEVLIAIIMDRITNTQNAEFSWKGQRECLEPCSDNVEAYKHLEKALACLQHRKVETPKKGKKS